MELKGMGIDMHEMKECRLMKGEDTTELVRVKNQKWNRK